MPKATKTKKKKVTKTKVSAKPKASPKPKAAPKKIVAPKGPVKISKTYEPKDLKHQVKQVLKGVVEVAYVQIILIL